MSATIRESEPNTNCRPEQLPYFRMKQFCFWSECSRQITCSEGGRSSSACKSARWKGAHSVPVGYLPSTRTQRNLKHPCTDSLQGTSHVPLATIPLDSLPVSSIALRPFKIAPESTLRGAAHQFSANQAGKSRRNTPMSRSAISGPSRIWSCSEHERVLARHRPRGHTAAFTRSANTEPLQLMKI